MFLKNSVNIGRHPRLACARGFTLVELLVVIVIIAVLAGFGVFAIRRGLESAKMASNTANLRQLGVGLASLSQDLNGYPPGWSFARKESWGDLLIREMHGDNVRQSETLLSPLVASKIPPDFEGETISNYAVSPFIFPQDNGAGTMNYIVRPAQLRRPNEQILLGDCVPRSEGAPYGHTMMVYWDLRTLAGNSGNPPVSPVARAETPVALPDNVVEITSGGSLPAFRNRGKAHFLFADGHVESLAPSELKFKHFAISY